MAGKLQQDGETEPKQFPMTELFRSLIGKGKMQLIFFLIFLLFFPFLAPFLKDFNDTLQWRIASNPNYPWPKYDDLWLACYSCIILIGLMLLFKFSLKPLAERIIVPRYTGKERTTRAEKLVESLFKALYFTFSVVFGYWVAKDSYFLSWKLGGKGDVNLMWTDFPFQSTETFPYIREYLMIQLGYHTQSFIVHILSKPRNDFMEMLLHHSLTICLLTSGYLMNYVVMSHLVLFVHDIPDLFVYLTRIFMDTKHKNITFLSYIGIMISWAYLRLYIYPFDLIRMGSFYDNPVSHEIYGMGILSGMVHVLLLMHIYWYVLLVKMGFKFVMTGVPADTQKKLNEE
ncbi:unnamed protein product [Blepharisma stoltei]|uniref:TLC domain-containing protein n=1 Tax=Blepharisma stoltei TaxID=1481888 RepID=A0AAU9JZY0_9CILI|nr:unnamed protein product [Blepharisma stoltei]